MAWVRLDDSMPHHPKVIAAGPQAFALDVAAIAYSNRYGLDGVIDVRSLCHVLPSLRSPSRVADKLVEVGRWERIEGGYRIHDYHEYQPTAAETRAKREDVSAKRAAAGRLGGLKSGEKRREANEANAKQTVEANRSPVPTRPDPTFKGMEEAEANEPAGVTKAEWTAALELAAERGAKNRSKLARYLLNQPDTLEQIRQRTLRATPIDPSVGSLLQGIAKEAS